MRLAIAGANSFIGKRIVAIAQAQSDIELILVIREGSSFVCPSCARVVYCNMEDYDQIGKLAGPGDVFVCLSWVGSRGMDRQNSEMQEFNYRCSMAAMKSMSSVGYKLLVSAGSQAEYGQCNGFISENTVLNPNTEYGKYKVKIFEETTELAKRYNIRFIEPRYFSLYGPGDYSKTLVMSCIEKMRKGVDVNLNECTQLWDYLYVDDAVEGLLKLCRNENSEGPYNFATGEYRHLRDFVMDIHTALESKSLVNFGAVEYKGLYIDIKPQIEKLMKDADWKSRTSFIDGVRETAKCWD